MARWNAHGSADLSLWMLDKAYAFHVLQIYTIIQHKARGVKFLSDDFCSKYYPVADTSGRATAKADAIPAIWLPMCPAK
jgi:hypothetical protein